jgi:hypothetical protein
MWLLGWLSWVFLGCELRREGRQARDWFDLGWIFLFTTLLED